MKKQLVLFLALALCLGLTACGDTESDDTQSGYETVMDMEFLDGMWSIDGTAKLYFDSTEGFYAYRTRWGLGGRGEFELSEASGRPMIFFNGLLYNFLLRDDGVLLPNRNGEGSGLTIHRNTFLRDDEAEIVEWDISNWDGMWQNALGETIVINSSLMQYIACSPDYSMSGTMDDEGEGMGLYLYDNGTRAYLCPGDDGNSFTLSAERFGRYGDDQHFDGVFYRNADFYAYTDMENAEFYEDEYSTFYIWYYDGVNRYLLGNDYTIGEDGLAYHDEDGLIYPAGWIPEEPYSAAYGYFNYGEGMEYLWYEDGGHLTEDDEPDPSEDEVPDWNGRLDGDPDSYWSWDSDLCQRNVSEFKGIWYYDGDLSAETYIVIDGNGNWSYYQRAPGAEPAEMDCGVFTYSMDEVSTYYADSTMYDGVSYRVFEVDEDSLVWGDEGVYYMME